MSLQTLRQGKPVVTLGRKASALKHGSNGYRIDVHSTLLCLLCGLVFYPQPTMIKMDIKSQAHNIYASYLEPIQERCNLKGQNLILFILGLLVVAALATSVIVNIKRVSFSHTERDYSARPFDLYDAETLCSERMQFQLGDSLLRSHVDEHSTREDMQHNVYRVYFKADIGTHYDYEEYLVYCFVDAWDNELSYFRKMENSLQEVKSTDLKFFQ